MIGIFFLIRTGNAMQAAAQDVTAGFYRFKNMFSASDVMPLKAQKSLHSALRVLANTETNLPVHSSWAVSGGNALL